MLVMDEEGRSYWGIFGIGLCAPLVASVVLIGHFYLAIGSGFLFALATTCIWPLTGFGLAIYSRIYESDELAEGALVSGGLGALLGLYLIYMIVSGYAEGMASFSQ